MIETIAIPADPTLKRYEHFAELRVLQRQMYNAVLCPVDRKPRFVIPKSAYRPPRDVSEALRRIDPAMEIIHDPLTAPDGAPPEAGCHLYSVKRGVLGGGHDLLILEASLQFQMDRVWPTGGPRKPGMWLVDWVRAHDKAQYGLDPEKADHEVCQMRVEHNLATAEAQRKSDEELGRFLFEEFWDPLWNRRRTGGCFSSRIPE